jgi:hypothetical protein
MISIVSSLAIDRKDNKPAEILKHLARFRLLDGSLEVSDSALEIAIRLGDCLVDAVWSKVFKFYD